MTKIQKILMTLLLPLLGAAMLVSCSESEDVFTPYSNWQARNAEWYVQITDSARTAIAQAKAQYGDDWEAHCDWRQYRSLLKQKDVPGVYTDSICVRILKRGTGTYCPTYSDTIHLSMRGWLMPATYKLFNADNVEVDSIRQEVFTQSYYGEFSEQTAAPQLMSVGSTIEGFSTALQYMHQGDDWLVYIPQQLGYGDEASDAIPAYSTLLFRLHLAAVYPLNTGVENWK